MINLEIFNSEKSYVTPDGTLHTSDELRMMYTIINVPDVKLVIETDVTSTFLYTVPEPLYTKAQRMGLDHTKYTTDEELLLAMEEILNAPQPEPEPSAEERIASAMEYQNLML